ncbi:MAG: hypothetical protein V1909_00230 [Candidatus Micrarchaeota archaeon]
MKLKIPNCVTTGMTNVTSDRMFVPFFDYDRCELKAVLEDARYLQTMHDLGTMVIAVCTDRKTPVGTRIGNYHLIGFTRLELDELVKALSKSRCDPKYKEFGLTTPSRCWVLRVSRKIGIASGKTHRPAMRLLRVLRADTEREASGAHVRFISKLFDISLMKEFKREDGCKVVGLIDYPTYAPEPEGKA